MGALFDSTAPPPLVRFMARSSAVLLPAAVSMAMMGPNGCVTVSASEALRFDQPNDSGKVEIRPPDER